MGVIQGSLQSPKTTHYLQNLAVKLAISYLICDISLSACEQISSSLSILSIKVETIDFGNVCSQKMVNLVNSVCECTASMHKIIKIHALWHILIIYKIKVSTQTNDNKFLPKLSQYILKPSQTSSTLYFGYSSFMIQIRHNTKLEVRKHQFLVEHCFNRSPLILLSPSRCIFSEFRSILLDVRQCCRPISRSKCLSKIKKVFRKCSGCCVPIILVTWAALMQFLKLIPKPQTHKQNSSWVKLLPKRAEIELIFRVQAFNSMRFFRKMRIRLELTFLVSFCDGFFGTLVVYSSDSVILETFNFLQIGAFLLLRLIFFLLWLLYYSLQSVSRDIVFGLTFW